MSKNYRMSEAMALLSLAAIGTIGPIYAADLADLGSAPVKSKPIIDIPFFMVDDNRLTLAYQFTATDPGYAVKTAKELVAFTHFDVWAYGTNFLSASLAKSDHADPAAPCNTALQGCAGAAEFYGLVRSTFGFNEIFNTRAFAVGPMRNASLLVGADLETENDTLAPNKTDFVAGLQFAFELPYKGFFNVSPLFYKEEGHSAFISPAVDPDGHSRFNATWAVETNYYMDLGFLPENLRYFAISGRASWIGPKGTGVSIPTATLTTTEFNSEPIRLTFDASKLAWGAKYSHFVELWVAYRYWQNKFGLDHNLNSNCIGKTAGSCTESTLYSGVSVKF